MGADVLSPLTNVVGVYFAMFFCNIWPRQTWLPLALGTIIQPTGITMLAVAIGWDQEALVFGMLALSGIGTGVRLMPGPLLLPRAEGRKHDYIALLTL
jgi:hypothetical protein